MNLRKVKGNFDRIFDKTLTDLVRGIRNNKETEAKYITQCIEEIKEELRHDSLQVKANAVSKLTYLQMLGYDISWSSFNIIEVMSSTKFSHKRIGYLAASQCFHENTEVMMLTTNMIRKDLNSQNMYDAGCAMSGLACFVTTDISRDLANDVLTLLNSTKPYLRKKAVLLLYKIFLKFPDALKPAFPRLKEKLEDPDSGVQSAAVNVICELARKNPKNYLSLAPVFFKLMTNSTNNWMLIKIIKLFGVMTKYEPLLGIKLSNPLISLIRSTSAMSLLYECINTVIAVLISISSGLPNHNASIQLCVQKLRILIEDSDQNLKYLGLLAMSKILKTHPKSVQAHKDLVLTCLDDKDESIRLRALDLLYGMVTKKNLMEIVQRLVKNVTEGQIGNKFRDELILKLIDICSQNDYQYIVNFEWYLSVLIELSRVEGGTIHGTLIAQQLLDVAIRVDSIRKFATEQMSILLENSSLFLNNSSSVCEVLYAAAWICGEFADYLPDQENTIYCLLSIGSFPPHITAVFIQNASKIISKIAANPQTDMQHFIVFCLEIEEMLLPFLKHQNLEIQERATSLSQIIGIFKATKYTATTMLQDQTEPTTPAIMLDDYETLTNGEEEKKEEKEEESSVGVVDNAAAVALTNFASLFYAYPLNPVAAKAQRKVPIPAGLELDDPFVDEESDDDDDSNDIGDDQGIHLVDEPEEVTNAPGQTSSSEADEVEVKRRKDAKASRRFEQDNNPHYLKSKKSLKKSAHSTTRKGKKTTTNFKEHNDDDDDDNYREAIERAEEASNDVLLTEYSSVAANAKSRQTSIPGLVSSDRFLLDMKVSTRSKKTETKVSTSKGGKKKKSKAEVVEEEEEEDESPKVMIRALEMPEGADLNENDDDDDLVINGLENADPHRALAKVSLEDFIATEPTKTKKNLNSKKSGKKVPKIEVSPTATAISNSKGKKKKAISENKATSSSNTKKALNDFIVGGDEDVKKIASKSTKKAKATTTESLQESSAQGMAKSKPKKKKEKAMLLLEDTAIAIDASDDKVMNKKSSKSKKSSSKPSKNRAEYEETLGSGLENLQPQVST